jgi:ADP-heptose:LPS heptosyltransferase
MSWRPVGALLLAAMRGLHAFDRRERGTSAFDPERVRRILVVSSTAIGDTLLSTPAIRAVRERYPGATIVALFNSQTLDLFGNNPDVDGIVPYYGGYRRFFRTILALRRHRFDLALIFHGNEPQATPMVFLAGVPFIFKWPNTSENRFLLSNGGPVRTWDDFPHGVDQRLAVAALAKCDPKRRPMTLPLAEEGRRAADRFLREEGVGDADLLVGFQCGASTLSRMWFPDRFAELGRRLVRSVGQARIVLTGSPAERDYCLKIGREIGERTIVAAGRLPLAAVPSLLSRLHVLVTGDTGIMHMAGAARTPIVGLFAVSDPSRSGPYYDLDRHVIIKKPRTCVDCVSKRCTYQKCMEAIEVEEVFQAVMRVLARTVPGTTSGAS